MTQIQNENDLLIISEQNTILAAFFSKQEHVKLAYLFGSAAKGKAGKLSDVDIAVQFDDSLSKKEIFKLQLNLIGDIAALLKTDKVDLVAMNDAPLSLNYEIIKANHHLFVRDRMEKIDFEQRLMSRYLDRRYYERRAASEFLGKVAVKGI
ncbi:MAG: nucleotidyltransferase domain-containing protein [Candidatus Methanoperedens sp.]|nr:nucleotidyltransferase domain-containing protein [Candidatus Methanoperedens sp.]MCZ7395373.1 nucleotidyltransferase domain-containing protein [Candidatus Methanoperedens sp.]